MNSTNDAQQTPATPEITNDADRRVLLIQALQRAQTEVVESRKYVDALEQQIRMKQERINALNILTEQNLALRQSLNLEIAQLQTAIASQQTQIKFNVAEIDYLKKELASVQKKYKKSLKREKWLLLGIGAIVLSRFIFK